METLIEPVIKLHSGSYFNYRDLDNNNLTIEDIAHALANTCRFAGHTNHFYSVAQHSIHVSEVARALAWVEGRNLPEKYLDEVALQGLMHDASEAVMVDMPSPLKRLLGDYKKLETRVEKSIMKKFNVPFPFAPEVKKADLVMLATERRDLLAEDNSPYWDWLKPIAQPASFTVMPLYPTVAKEIFLARFYKLTGF